MNYRLDLWLKSDLTPEQIKKELRDLEEEFNGTAGDKTTFKSENQGKRKLAYRIKGQSDGYFLVLSLNASRIGSDFATFLNRRPSVLRYLLTKLKVEK